MNERPKETRCLVCGKLLEVHGKGAVPRTCADGKCRSVFREHKTTGATVRSIMQSREDACVREIERIGVARSWYRVNKTLAGWREERAA